MWSFCSKKVGGCRRSIIPHTSISVWPYFIYSLAILSFFQSSQHGLGGHLAVYHAGTELEQEHELAIWAAQISFQAIPRIQKPARTKSVFLRAIRKLRAILEWCFINFTKQQKHVRMLCQHALAMQAFYIFRNHQTTKKIYFTMI